MTTREIPTCASDAAPWCGPDDAMDTALATDVAGIGTPSWSFSRLCAMLGSITVPIAGLDQLTKLYIASYLPLYETRAIIPNWLDLTYTLNPGAAFSLFATMPAPVRKVLFLVLSCAANLVDRLARGRVVDFIYFHHDSFSYPVFNVADSAITIGVAIILVGSFLSGPAPDRSNA